eukprot:TRINITY_DN57351_c0_g1_i1.p1 TRINITY_DN57351_c0_g1~~TRINITY_DN57351_c0_g1_i1.p1  ORF type:complete len:769 (-),score=128.65 TRINITY_DN57351_c0_g1_i1:104-2410(-)
MAAADVARARQIQQVYSEWCVKAAEIVLASRIETGSYSDQQSSSSFNLKIPEPFGVRGEQIARPDFFQQKSQRCFLIEIYAVRDDPSNVGKSSEGQEDDRTEATEDIQVLERWSFTFSNAQSEPALASLDHCDQTLIQKMSITLRSLMCFVRILPAYASSRSAKDATKRRWRCRVEAARAVSSANRSASTKDDFVSQDFTSVPSSLGTLRLTVSQWSGLLPAATSSPVAANATTFGSQLEQLEVEEEYVAGVDKGSIGGVDDACGTASSVPGSRLDKIAEEPEGNSRAKAMQNARVQGSASSQPMEQSRAVSPGGERSSVTGNTPPRDRRHSWESAGSSQSSTSRSVPDRAVVLTGTPPLVMAGLGRSPVQGLITLGPQPAISEPSSSAPSPFPSPQVRPTQEPQRGIVAGSGGYPCGSTADQEASGENALEAPRPVTREPELTSGGGASGKDIVAATGAGFDDLSDIWGRRSPSPSCDQRSRRQRQSESFASRGTERSLSPDDAVGCRQSLTASAGSGAAAGAGALDLGAYEDEDEAEIRMFGMSDDEDDDEPRHTFHAGEEDEDDLGRNVVVSTLEQGGGGGAFAGCAAAAAAAAGAGSLDIGGLGGLLGGEDADMERRRPSLQSPLIATLNPFSTPPKTSPRSSARNLPMPELELPPAAQSGDYAGEDSVGCSAMLHPQSADAFVTGASAGVAATDRSMVVTAADSGAGETPMDRLLVEMGDLVCKLQQRRGELAITQQEVSADELLAQLDHFREVDSLGLGGHS